MRFAYPPYSIRPFNRVEALGAPLPGRERGCCEHGAQAAVGFFDQCCPVALFDDAACVEDDEVIGVADGGETMGDDHQGECAVQADEGVANPFFVAGVEGAGGFVEDQQEGLPQQGAGEGDALAFATREVDAALANAGVESLGEMGDEIGGGDLVQGLP